ncbi:PaaI family thioesterase [Hyphomonas jannaschiana]|uniref:Thioesterase family protein n=1 Tax=Hyphomonas jannaschiana VP2 TaxID=1280952 RepID=A0A059FC99_9PROT|nr:PaaI family thioesterase [Hyphomonas jannaschiana]KCZ88171.1 thioesterase family protein [Hyphomonas jannaschiana VP2]
MTKTIEDTGEFAGWTTWKDEPFEFESAGPFYFRVDEEGAVAAFRVQRKHMNAGGVVHGGCLMTFADFSLFAIGHEAMEGAYGVTVAFNAEFISGALEGERLEARGDVLRKGGSLSFIRGIISGEDGRPVMNFSGTIKKRKQS